MANKGFKAPKGTRDLYPEDALRRRWLTGLWRNVAIRHGFEEVDGPTFEMLDLYTVKSGEGIVSELFSFQRTGGKETYALRPELTPTVARMIAARAAQLQKPTKWFSIGPFFRAERPQRGRLREFLQWNVDAFGLPGDADDPKTKAEIDAELIACCVGFLHAVGLGPDVCKAHVNDREAVEKALLDGGVSPDSIGDALSHLDKVGKVKEDDWRARAGELGISGAIVELVLSDSDGADAPELAVEAAAAHAGVRGERLRRDARVVRGLAYYTGTVFEVLAEGERAIAGGGRYDGLVELFGGPQTPAVGFAMGDVVVSLLLEERGLVPVDAELRDAIALPQASTRPDVFVIAENEDAKPLVTPLLAALRQGVEHEGFDGKPWDAGRYRVAPRHARRSYKSTSNPGKLLQDAERQLSRFAAIVRGPDDVQLRDLATREDLDAPGGGSFSVDPASEKYIGAGIGGV